MTVFAVKGSVSQVHRLDVSTARTLAGGAFPAINLVDGFAPLGGDVLENAHELGEGQVTHLAAPQRLHGLDIQVFQKDHVELVANLVSQLELVVPALVGDAN